MSNLVILISIIFIGAGLMKEHNYQTETVLEKQDTQPKELGKVKWLRDINVATRQAANENKPVFLLFQEVPGCATCRNYGQDVLSHPLIVEAIETYFVPLAIFNNKGGEDRKVMDYFQEPSWNNPVVRIIDDKRKNLIDRISGNYSVQGVAEAMIKVLKKQNIAVPAYLGLLQEEHSARAEGTETAYLSMYCFWSGEKKIADIEGVVETHAGFMNGREVVKVEFAPSVIQYKDLLKAAKTKSCASHVYTDNLNQQLSAEQVLGSEYASEKSGFRIDRETKYYLYKSSYRFLPMTPLQAVRANSLIGKGQSPNAIFSPRQLTALKYIQEHPGKKWKSAINENIIKAWENLVKNMV